MYAAAGLFVQENDARGACGLVVVVAKWWAKGFLPVTTGGLGGGAGSATADSQGRYDGDLKRCSGVTADEQRWGGECGRARRLAEGAFGCCG